MGAATCFASLIFFLEPAKSKNTSGDSLPGSPSQTKNGGRPLRSVQMNQDSIPLGRSSLGSDGDLGTQCAREDSGDVTSSSASKFPLPKGVDIRDTERSLTKVLSEFMDFLRYISRMNHCFGAQAKVKSNSKTHRGSQLTFDRKKYACVSFEKHMDRITSEAGKRAIGEKEMIKLQREARKRAAKERGVEPYMIKRWKASFSKAGVPRVSEIFNVPMKAVFPEFSQTRGRDRKHIASGTGGHNVTKIVKDHADLLFSTFTKLTELWRVATTWEHVAVEFELMLAMERGVYWEPYSKDDQEDQLHKAQLCRNYLSSARRGRKWRIKCKSIGVSQYSREDKVKAVALQQTLLEDAIVRLHLQSHEHTLCEDETAFTATGNLIGRGLHNSGEGAKNHRVASGQSGNKVLKHMFMTVVTMKHGVRMFFYHALTEPQWRNPTQRYKVKPTNRNSMLIDTQI